MDADLSHTPERVGALVAALDDAVVAVGSRYVPQGSVQNWAWSRRLISRLGNLYVRVLLAVPVRDNASFKAFRAGTLHAIDVLASTSNGSERVGVRGWSVALRSGGYIAIGPVD